MRRYGIWIATLLLTFIVATTAMAGSRTVTDILGRVVDVPRSPQRVVALAPSITEIVFALGQQHRLKGATRFSDYPPAALQLPKVGSYVHLDVERIAALKPDLCIGIKDGNPRTAVAQLESLNIPFFALHPMDLESVMHSVKVIGDLLEAPVKAKQIVAGMRLRIESVKAQVAKRESRPKVFVQIGVSPIVSAGSHTFIDQLIKLAGGTNVAAGASAYPRFSREQVITLAPEVMVISSMARATVFEQVKAEWMQWSAIPAVKRGAVYIAPTNIFDRPTPRLVEGLEQMARYIHPQLFEAQP